MKVRSRPQFRSWAKVSAVPGTEVWDCMYQMQFTLPTEKHLAGAYPKVWPTIVGGLTLRLYGSEDTP